MMLAIRYNPQSMTADQSPIVTRFAPSPTGYLHVGGARTALFNWAYARGRGGRFLLRIEDTDRKRSSEAAEQAILDDLKWLGLDWDNAGHEPRQSDRLDLYQAAIDQLIEAGKAYADADDPDVIRFRMDRDIAFTDAVYGTVAVKADDLEDFVIRKGKAGEFFPTFHFAVVVDDAEMGVTHVIRGQEHLSNTPKHAALYDALAEVTGDAEKYKRPTWAHTPSIMNPDGSKMSKRDKAKAARKALKEHLTTEGTEVTEWAAGASSDVQSMDGIATDSISSEHGVFSNDEAVGFAEKRNDLVNIANYIAFKLNIELPEINLLDFAAAGYIPDTLCNYLALLGWNPKDGTERFDLDWLKDRFELAGINKANAKFDREKLIEFNRQDIEAMPPAAFAASLTEYVNAAGTEFAEAAEREPDRFGWICAAVQQRLRVLSDIADFQYLFFAEKMPPHEVNKGTKKAILKGTAEGYDALAEVNPVLADLAEADWTPETLQKVLEDFSTAQGYKNMGVVAQPLRVAIAGVPVTPPIDLTLAVVGRDETLRRIDACLAFYRQPAEEAKANAS